MYIHAGVDVDNTVCRTDLFHLHRREIGGLARVSLTMYDMWTLVLLRLSIGKMRRYLRRVSLHLLRRSSSQWSDSGSSIHV